MTEHELQCLLVAEREWRITELEFCKKIPFLYTYPSFRSHYPLFWKFCIPMIYSHWEGFCVASMKLLVDYLNEISLSYEDAANHVLLLDNRKRFSYLQGNCSTDQQSRFLNEFLASQKTGVHIDRSVVSANSNLNFKQLSKMLSYFEISVCIHAKSFYDDDSPGQFVVTLRMMISDILAPPISARHDQVNAPLFSTFSASDSSSQSSRFPHLRR